MMVIVKPPIRMMTPHSSGDMGVLFFFFFVLFIGVWKSRFVNSERVKKRLLVISSEFIKFALLMNDIVWWDWIGFCFGLFFTPIILLGGWIICDVF